VKKLVFIDPQKYLKYLVDKQVKIFILSIKQQLNWLIYKEKTSTSYQ